MIKTTPFEMVFIIRDSMKGIFRKLLLAACLIASMVIPVYANAPPAAEGESAKYIGLSGILMVAFLIFCGMAITCFCEWLVSLAFRFDHRNDRLILWTNVVSQLLMWLVYILLYNFLKLDRIWIIIILEVLVYAGEFLFYWKKMHEASWLKCLIYTITANTASLVLGLLIL